MEIAINRAYAIRFLGFLGFLLIIPLFHFQPLAGPLVNAVFFLSLYFLKLRDSLILAAFPSLTALAVGLLPLQAMAIIPYIIFSNFILIVTFNYLRNKNYFLGVFTASLIKFLFLFLASNVLFTVFFQKQISQKLASMMSIPQFITAIIGGIIAYIILKKYGQGSH